MLYLAEILYNHRVNNFLIFIIKKTPLNGVHCAGWTHAAPQIWSSLSSLVPKASKPNLLLSFHRSSQKQAAERSDNKDLSNKKLCTRSNGIKTQKFRRPYIKAILALKKQCGGQIPTEFGQEQSMECFSSCSPRVWKGKGYIFSRLGFWVRLRNRLMELYFTISI